MTGAVAEDFWEQLWSPYDEPTYRTVLAHVRSDDVVLEIGAGDLRLARRLAGIARRVYAIEINKDLLPSATDQVDTLGAKLSPDNLHLTLADAYQCPFPKGVTLAVLLMRHCRQFTVIADKLAAAGCRRLITNARWGLGVELIDLMAPRLNYSAVSMGWYACWCGATGFVPGPAEKLTAEREATMQEVVDCPACAGGSAGILPAMDEHHGKHRTRLS